MRVLHIIPYLDEKFGGPPEAVINICKYQCKNNIQAEIATILNAKEKKRNTEGINIHYFKSNFDLLRYSNRFGIWLSKNISSYSLIHIHGLLLYPNIVAGYMGKRKHIPYIVRPKGMLYPWCLNNKSKWKKKICMNLFEKTNLKNASYIHFTTHHEQLYLDKKIHHDKDFVLPVGVKMPKKISKKIFDSYFPNLKNFKILLMLARLNRIKKHDLLLKSIENLLIKNHKWKLVFAGEGDRNYSEYLRSLVKKWDIQNKVIFQGHVSGDKKNSLLQHSRAFILPSYSENFGIAAVEAMAAGTPVLLSEGVGIAEDVKKAKAGLVFPLKKEKISHAVEKIMADDTLCSLLSKNALRLVKKKYDWNKITQKQIEIYKKIIEEHKQINLKKQNNLNS